MPRWRRKSWAPICANAQAARRIRLPHGVLRPLRARLHPHARQLRSAKARPAFASTREFVDRAADLVVSYGGSLSGEHGDGQSRGALLPKMFGPELMKAFGEFKTRVGSGQPDESAQGASTPICPPKTCGWARTTSRSIRRRISSFRTTTARLRRPRCAALAWANAASTIAARCARATW